MVLEYLPQTSPYVFDVKPCPVHTSNMVSLYVIGHQEETVELGGPTKHVARAWTLADCPI